MLVKLLLIQNKKLGSYSLFEHVWHQTRNSHNDKHFLLWRIAILVSSRYFGKPR